ncbi:FliC/FljB family flagellin [Alcaligenes phenolicus]|uniref:Flagellin n=1 Tax=Alcaligenes phenolicus TaxID=232846 RepID=A0AAW5VSU4_9BURK|nr:FliC/FljB family flagellin [Alcaligenes phenolicus]MCX5566933.1 FliC/FljB family flagellin [Alcaligenes phenolicus]
MSVINTNYLALVSQNNLTKSQNSLGTAIERLSSGLRINSAKDDAAGQAIANRFTANINGLTQAARNANDGISIAQTTEGSLNEINENLQRIRTLRVQASTGSNSDSDLKSIQNEINERLSEINRVSKETQFNGKYVLGEDATSLTVQVGANDNEIITIDLAKIDSTTLKLDDFKVSGKSLVSAQGNADTDTILVNGETYTFATTPGTDAGDKELSAAAPAITATDTAAAGRTNTLVKNDKGEVFIKSVDTTDTDDVRYFQADMTATPADGTTGATLTVKVGAEVANLTEDTAEAGVTKNPLAKLDAALQQVDDLRSHLGAIQNRFQSTIANLNNTVNNLSAARSRIEDADYAVEVSNMTRSQILQQAGTSVLAQANQVPQTVLSLLR